MNSFEQFVVFSDSHGRINHLRTLEDMYPGIPTISVGDGIDGYYYSNVKSSIEWMLGNGTVCLAGNHDWVTDAVMNETDEEKLIEWANVWHGYHFNTLGSYGLKNFDEKTTIETAEIIDLAEQLKERLATEGHMEYFRKLEPYFDGGFVAVHAGFILGASLEQQKAELDKCFGEEGGIVDHEAEPIQIFDSGPKPYALAKSENGLLDTEKVLITGHFHNLFNAEARRSDNGKRIRLAAGYGNSDAPIYVWESWTGKVVPVYPKEPYKLP